MNFNLKEIFKPSFILLTIVFFYLVFLIREDIVKFIFLKSEQESFKTNIVAERSVNSKLKTESRLLSRNEYLEGIARQKLGLIKRGEEPYKVVR